MKNEFIENKSDNINQLVSSINKILSGITEEACKANIDSKLDEYLKSGVVEEKIDSFFEEKMEFETKKKVLELLKKEIELKQLKNTVGNFIENILKEKLDEFVKKETIPIVYVLKKDDKIISQSKGEFHHKMFEKILSQVQLDEPIMLIGPAGSGKNVAIAQVANVLNQKMYYTNCVSNEFKLMGFIDAGGNYRETEFYKAFKNGGIFFLDEIDNSDPSALIVLNSALANGYMAFPHETIEAHPDFKLIAAANTWGFGADAQYVGRNKLDESTLDRFDSIFFDYDTNLEEKLYPNEEVLKFMWSFRNSVVESKIPHIVSTRGIGKVYKKHINNIPKEDILTSNVIKNLTDDDLYMIVHGMKNINEDTNSYYKVLRKMKK